MVQYPAFDGLVQQRANSDHSTSPMGAFSRMGTVPRLHIRHSWNGYEHHWDTLLSSDSQIRSVSRYSASWY